MGLSEEHRQYILKNRHRQSVRQMAKTLGVPRSLIEHEFESAPKTGPAAPAPSRWENLPSLVYALILAAAVGLTYSNAVNAGFVWDDRALIVENPLLKETSLQSLEQIFKNPVGGEMSFSYRPLQILSYWPDRMGFGFKPWAYHGFNLIWHALAVVSVFVLFARLLGSSFKGFITALIFAVHPTQIAVAAYVSGRADSLGLTLALCSLALLTAASGPWAVPHLLISILFLGASLFAKEVFLVTPVIGALYLLIYRPGNKRILIAWLAGSAVVASLYMVVRLSVLGTVGQGGIGELAMPVRILAAIQAIGHYARLFVWPSDLHMAYQFAYPRWGQPATLWGLCVLAAASFAAFRDRRNKARLFAWIWVMVWLLPLLNIFVLMNSPMAEHWLYVPLIGLAALAVDAFANYAARHPAWARAKIPVLTSVVLALGLTTFSANPTWKDEIRLFENTLKYVKRDPNIYSNLGVAYIEKGEKAKARELFEKALAIDPNWENARYNLEMLKREKS